MVVSSTVLSLLLIIQYDNVNETQLDRSNKMTQQFEKLTAEDLDCYRELFSGITRKFQRFCYSNFYIFNVQKTIKVLKIYREWLLSQENTNFGELYQKFWKQFEMDITAVSLLLLPKGHNKEQEIEHITRLIEQIDELGTSYIFIDVQSNSVGFATNNFIYPASRDSFKKVLQRSQKEKNIEYCNWIKAYLDTYPELYPDVDKLVAFFDDNEKDLDINSNLTN
ncbi:hypothetical protein HMPREF0548_1229 [Lactobacillus ultunensis DSM 16047]|uniref:Uncharacterized protein n=2 Tax=Lactobacillus ultunensis TaxID=227945 RepID=C2ENI3_9LACO|nr:hypothetical protein HMPREF0548_1229 [Lactobacillus ultunensis DSM 16047]